MNYHDENCGMKYEKKIELAISDFNKAILFGDSIGSGNIELAMYALGKQIPKQLKSQIEMEIKDAR